MFFFNSSFQVSTFLSFHCLRPYMLFIIISEKIKDKTVDDKGDAMNQGIKI